jgi:hypothetical protein
LKSVSGSGGELFVVGDAATILESTTRGASWNDVSPMSGDTLFGVWSGGGATYAVGVFNGGTQGYVLASTDGMNFTQQSNTANVLRAVWGSGASDVYALGDYGTAYHSTGNGVWTPQTTGSSANLYAIWGSSSSDVYIVGASGTILHGS